uniref:Uncharacterized protein n=1 Tax=Rhizophora mucronata TaxID=61149 RepID=A0A2P2QL01_RHIMU
MVGFNCNGTTPIQWLDFSKRLKKSMLLGYFWDIKPLVCLNIMKHMLLIKPIK